MYKFSSLALVLLLLTGCQLGGKDLSKTLEVGQQIAGNQALLTAGQEVIDGGKELIDTGKQAAGDLGSGAGKILSGGRIIVDEAQEIARSLNTEQALENPQPEEGDKVWIRTEDQGCDSSEPCFAWRPDLDSAWQVLSGSIENIDDLPAQIDNWQVTLSTAQDLLESWQVDEIITTNTPE